MANHSPHSDQKQSPSVQPSGKVEAAPAGHPAHAHEGTDVAIMPLVFSLVAFLVLAVFVLGLTYAIFRATESVQVGSQEFQSGLTVHTKDSNERQIRKALPDEPRVQGIPGFHGNTPSQDMAAFSVRNDVMLGDYVAAEPDRPARIPAERAMQILLDKKAFKVAAPTSQPAAAGTAPALTAKPEGVPTEASKPTPAPSPAPAEGTTK